MPAGPQFCFDTFRLEVHNEQLWCGAQALHLKTKALHVLRYLLEHAGQLVTKEALFATVWPELVVSEGVLTNCIGELRKALGDAAQAPRFIATVHRRGYRFIAPVTLVGPSEATAPAAAAAALDSLTPPPLLVGRETEVQALRHCLEQARQGQRQVVFVTGEAGIGKTTVVDALLGTMTRAVPLWVAWGQCIARYGAGEAYLPVLDALGRLCRAPGHARLIEVLGQYAPTWVEQMPGLLSPADRETMPRTGQGATRERMLRELAEALEVATAERPLVLVLEDLHWSDHATVDLLAWLARRREPARLLLLGTYRPAEVIVHRHPLRAVAQELALHGQCVELRLEGLSEAAVAAYLTARLPGCAWPAGLARMLHRRTEGQPLFMVQAVDTWVRQGWVTEVAGQWELQVGVEAVETGVPENVRQLIQQQFDGLSPAEQRILEAASVVGVEFTTAAVAAGLDTPMELVEEPCEALVRRGQFLQGYGEEEWTDGTVSGHYGFRHALYQEVLYRRLGSARRQRWHRAIGARLEAGYGAEASHVAAALAVHFERGREYPRAVRYLQQAAEQALRRWAYQEAGRYLRHAVALLQTLPDTPARAQQELAMQITLGQVLFVTLGQGATEVEQAYTRAQALCEQLSDTSQLGVVLEGLRVVALVRGELQKARELGDDLLRLGQRAADTAILLEAHYALGVTGFWRGEVVPARTHLEQSLTLCTAHPARFQSIAGGTVQAMVALRSYTAWTLWLLGYPAQALQQSQAALTLARELTDSYSLVFALSFAARIHWFRGETPLAHERNEAALTLARQQEFPLFVAMETILRGWALAEQGHGAAGLVQMHQGLAAWRATQAGLERPYWLALLAAAYGKVGQATEGFEALAEALTLVAHTGERWWEAELYRLQGELHVQAGTRPKAPEGATAEAEACFQQALAVARRQQAKSLELRVAMSLARLWQQQGKPAEAQALLAPIYGWFTEGFDTADLQEAKSLLMQLSGASRCRRAQIDPSLR